MSAVREIGSDFALDPAAPDGPGSGPWMDRAVGRMASGREALRLLLRDAPHRTRLVLPAYLCDSVEQAAAGSPEREVIYVPVDETLAPRPDALADSLIEPERTVFVRVQVFSRAWSAALEAVVADAEAAGVLVIEDRTHTLFNEAGPRHAHWFASARKWVPLPDGGLVAGAHGPPDAPDEAASAVRAEALLAKWRFLHAGTGRKDAFLATLRETEERFDTERRARAMSTGSSRRLDGAQHEPVARARRENHATLRRALQPTVEAGHLDFLEPPLGPGVVPLGLPVVCEARDALRRHLIARRVYCPVHWPLPPAVAAGSFPVAQERQRHLLTLVIDQRYTAQDMARLAGCVEEFFAP